MMHAVCCCCCNREYVTKEAKLVDKAYVLNYLLGSHVVWETYIELMKYVENKG